MNENFILYLWSFQLFQRPLSTIDNQLVDVISPGTRNTDSGPDFFNGKIRIGETLWAGNIEIHLKSSDWYKHQHHLDDAYNNIVLHVVYENDISINRKNGELIPVVELKGKFDENLLFRYQSFIAAMHPIPCHKLIGSVNHFTQMNWFDALMIERLKDKTSTVSQSLSSGNQDFNEVFYQKISRNFGFKTNADAMEQLAISVPLNVILKHGDQLFQLEALLFGQAGFLSQSFKDEYPKRLFFEYQFLADKYKLQSMDKKVWKFMRMRPANFPTIRIAQFADFLNKAPEVFSTLLSTNKFAHVQSLFKVSASPYWNNHFHFDQVASPNRKKKLGQASVNLIIINTIIPFLFIYSEYIGRFELHQKALDWLDQIPGENNRVTRLFAQCGIEATSALHSQALLQLNSEYCSQKRCLDCRLGHELLNRKDI